MFVAAFGLSTLLHIYQIARMRTWYFIPVVIGGLFETVGYIGRYLSSQDQWKLIPYIMQSVTLLIAPAFFAASIYMVLSRIIQLVDGEKFALIRKRWLTKIFVIFDCFSFLVQSSGAGMLANAKDQSAVNLGTNIIIAGLFIQIGAFAFFVLVALLFHIRIRKDPTAAAMPGSGIAWEKHLYVLYAASLLIFIRSVFRGVEYIQGNASFLHLHEIFLFIFDGALMFNVMMIFNLIHPGQITAESRRKEQQCLPLQAREIEEGNVSALNGWKGNS
jgi:hypothetical protein